MTKCEFEKQCFPGPGRRCADAEHPEDCDFYDFAVLVHNQAIKDVLKLPLHDYAVDCRECKESIEALKKKESP